jgi:hypothetical protein
MKSPKDTSFSGVVLALALVTATLGFAQERTHRGFHGSIQTGPAFGYVNGNTNMGYSLKVTGPAYAFDMQAGGAITEDLILHGNIGFRTIFSPQYETTMGTTRPDSDFNETFVGGGVTYYLPHNFFFTGVFGVGNHSVYDETNNTTTVTDAGGAMQLRAGKEWWVAPRWALGAAIEYGITRSGYTENEYEEKWQSNRFAIKFVATFYGGR